MGAEGALVPFAEVDMRTSIRPTVAEIDLGAVQRNLIRFREQVGRSVAVFRARALPPPDQPVLSAARVEAATARVPEPVG